MCKISKLFSDAEAFALLEQLYEIGPLVMSNHDTWFLEKDALLLMLLFTHGINGSSVPGKVHDVDKKASRAPY